MADKVIALACAAGMSTSLLVSKMQKAAAENGKDYEIFAKSTADIDNCSITLRDLTSRLQSDKIFNINDLNDEDKIKLMMFYCSERGLEVPEKEINYIINNCSRDLYFLCAFIKTIDKTSLSMKKRITIPFIKKVISKLAG